MKIYNNIFAFQKKMFNNSYGISYAVGKESPKTWLGFHMLSPYTRTGQARAHVGGSAGAGGKGRDRTRLLSHITGLPWRGAAHTNLKCLQETKYQVASYAKFLKVGVEDDFLLYMWRGVE
jgi:hypothetical protein